MRTSEENQAAIEAVTDAAVIHSQAMRNTLIYDNLQPGFARCREQYVEGLEADIRTVQTIRLEEGMKLSERVRGLDLAEAVALLHAVEDRLRNLSGRSPLA